MFGSALPIITAKRPFNPHVRERLAERHVPEGAVDEVLNNHHASWSKGATTIYVGRVRGRNLRVYVKAGTNPPVVTTVAFEEGE